ncbi:unnamed protein product [Protopolystoma xenopodis]|uniref:Uncharacterized protein n=1 Tax=Protopolystoma xenopodis TaxID=117903 RepID=A0A448XLW4_9PLAT|nr:unnamed protein product [Protopolystoma xenopodis]
MLFSSLFWFLFFTNTIPQDLVFSQLHRVAAVHLAWLSGYFDAHNSGIDEDDIDNFIGRDEIGDMNWSRRRVDTAFIEGYKADLICPRKATKQRRIEMLAHRYLHDEMSPIQPVIDLIM